MTPKQIFNLLGLGLQPYQEAFLDPAHEGKDITVISSPPVNDITGMIAIDLEDPHMKRRLSPNEFNIAQNGIPEALTQRACRNARHWLRRRCSEDDTPYDERELDGVLELTAILAPEIAPCTHIVLISPGDRTPNEKP
jgi:hypothetical protein